MLFKRTSGISLPLCGVPRHQLSYALAIWTSACQCWNIVHLGRSLDAVFCLREVPFEGDRTLCTLLVQVITDPLTGRSKGYGFVRFGNEAERDRSLTEMSGHIINSRPIRVSVATAKKSQSSAMVSLSPSEVAVSVAVRGLSIPLLLCSGLCLHALHHCAVKGPFTCVWQGTDTSLQYKGLNRRVQYACCRLVVPTRRLTLQTMTPQTLPSSSVGCPPA